MEFITIIIYLSIYIGLVATSFFVLTFMNDKKKKRLFFTDDELPFVSIIIPAYNEEKSIAKTIESIVASDYPKDRFEVIVVDDGSKDNTLKIAQKFENNKIKVFHKENGGKGSALNFGLEKAKGEIIFTMDADTFVTSTAMKRMVKYFKNEDVMSVTPAIILHEPKSILQKIQQIEYLMGLFLRKTFAALNAIYVAPGAFASFRKKFFDKYGGYDENNITEDLEVGLRIQSKGYFTENCPDALVYTVGPKKFKSLLIQRRRWYVGLIKNTLRYREMLSSKYGDLGLFILPISLISVFFALFVIVYFFFKILMDIKNELLFFQSINFNFLNLININFYVIERFLFLFFTNPVVISILFFIIISRFYIHYASKKIGRVSGLIISLPLFFIFFSVLFGFWWLVSLIYALFVKDMKWR